jgi:hypothetical protein
MSGFAQNDTSSQTVKPPTIFTADSLASGNTKDVLTSFFQLAIDQLTGPNKQLNFNSNPFALMLKSNPVLNVDTNYRKYRALRKTNFGFGLQLDSAYHFNGFSSGVKYALVNKRDTATSATLSKLLHNSQIVNERHVLLRALNAHIITLQSPQREIFEDAVHKLFSVDTPFNKLDTAVQRKVRELVQENNLHLLTRIVDEDPSSNFTRANRANFDSLKNEIKQGLLWTVGVSDTTYKDQFFFSNLVLNTEIVKGFGAYKPGNNLEYDIKAALNLLDDSLAKGRDLKRAILNFEPGLNWVIRNKENDKSWLEFKISGSYSHNFTTLYNEERRDSLTFNGTLRIRVYEDIWIPLEFKYDPRSGNVLGFINVHFNFTTLGSLVRAGAARRSS